MNQPKEIKLKVAEAIQDDVNKGIVRIDSNFMKEIGVRPGDIVEIESGRKTVTIVDRAYPGDIGLNIVRMDGIARRNAKTGIGEMVTVRKAEVTEAKSVTIAPARKGVVVKASPMVFKQGLLGRAVLKGDIISIGGTKRRKSAMSSSPFFDDIFEMLDEEFMGNFVFSELKFIVAEANPKQAVFISENTEVKFNPEPVDMEAEETIPEVSYEDIGGLDEELKKIREMVELPLKHPEIFETLGIEAPKGVLLHGPPGTGKTLLAKAVANETNSHFILINGPEIMSKFYGQSEENLRKKFEDAEKNAPSIIFIDEIDAIASKREEVQGEVEKRVVAQLLGLMDGLQSRGKVVVLAATNIPNQLDPALRRPGRFDREIEIAVPNKESRLDILRIHTRNMPLYMNPESINPSYKIEDINVNIKKLVEKLDGKDMMKLVIANIKKSEGLDVLAKDFQGYLQKNIPKDAKKGTKDFLTICSKQLADDLVYNLRYNLTSEASEELLANAINDKISQLNSPDETNNLIRKLVKDFILEDLASITHGFVGADLASLVKEAAMIVLRRVLPELKLNEEEAIPRELLDKLKVSKEDIKNALKVVRPSALREVLLENPNVKWDNIGGLDNVKQELIEAVEWPLKYPEAFKRLGVNPPKGILLYGPPGTGKTLLARAVATEAQANFIPVKGPEMLSKWVGESEKAVRKIFEKARQASPAIIFFDEMDSIAPARGGGSSDSHVTERVVNQLLTEIDGLDALTDVVIIAATNRPDIIDTALMRPGRFDRVIMTPVPAKEGREKIFNVHTKNMPLKDVSLLELAEKTEGYVGADIEAVCREAAILALRKDIKAKEITMEHFHAALEKVYPSVTKNIEEAYAEIGKHFSSARAKQMEEEKPNYLG